jgi:hypothetical protein
MADMNLRQVNTIDVQAIPCMYIVIDEADMVALIMISICRGALLVDSGLHSLILWYVDINVN